MVIHSSPKRPCRMSERYQECPTPPTDTLYNPYRRVNGRERRSRSYKQTSTTLLIGVLILGVLSITTLVVQGFTAPFPSRVHTRDPRILTLNSIQRPKHDGGKEDAGSLQKPLPPTSLGVSSRRAVIQTLVTASAAIPLAAVAGKPELDSTGNLFSPKSDMLRGGSDAARGIPGSRAGKKLKPGKALQTVYETRFIAYLSRFLLNFDPAAHSWWVKQGLGDSWEVRASADPQFVEATFASFAESVEVGLADYFVGPYGSYSSVSAAKAGLMASQPAPSISSQSEEQGLLVKLIFGQRKASDKKAPADSVDQARNGILNLLALLKARYNSVAAKRQLAVLFSFISSPNLQPTAEIRSLLGEADNATVSCIQIIRPSTRISEVDSRTSCRRGGGYSLESFPKVTVEAPPALGDSYRRAELLPIMQPTSRILRIKLQDGGCGYKAAPQVSIIQGGIGNQCEAAAILDRNGSVESILVLDPGYGYGGRKDAPPIISIEPPPKIKGKESRLLRRAKAIAELEYEIIGADIVCGGTGFAQTEPPKIKISPPQEDPDWFLALQEQPEMRMTPVTKRETVRAEVTEMRSPDGNVAFLIDGVPAGPRVDDDLIERLQRDPLEMLPSSIRPNLRPDSSIGGLLYTVPALDLIPQFVAVLSPRYRAYDPVFGGVGSVPVTKGAMSLSASEYGRLALSGALCTVVVRTALNPLELIKTKQQLLNDDELLDFARERFNKKQRLSEQNDAPLTMSASTLMEDPGGNTAVATSTVEAPTTAADPKVKIGTIDMVQSLVELRGPLSLFQSADITFLASLVFGSFGFGATELFRRSFTSTFSDGGESGSEIILLVAAALATVVTAAAASPFEVLRVRSMGMLESKKWTSVLEDFLEDTTENTSTKSPKRSDDEEFDLKSLNPRDLLPLWSGFAPTLSRELPFAVTKFLIFDIISNLVINFLNARAGEGALPVQVGVGPVGLGVSAAAGALAGIVGAFVSHPADLILTYTSASKKKVVAAADTDTGEDGTAVSEEEDQSSGSEWKDVVKELISRDGGLANLFIGLPARSIFFFLVIGLQFFLYDYVKGLFQVGSDDLSLVLDVFYAVRAGLLGMDGGL